jgi:hypothetical protein
MTMFRNAVLMALTLPLVACSYFESSSTSEPQTMARPVGRLTTDCGRLQPLFGPEDQELTREKMDAGLKAEMAKWDTDGNGELSHREIDPLNDSLRENSPGASPVTDWNADGRIDEREFGAGWRTMFELCDRNASQTVSLRELGYSPRVAPPRTEPAAPKKKPEGASERPKAGY